MEKTLLSNGIFTLNPILTPEECRDFIARTEAAGFELATISTGRGPALDLNVRNSGRVIVDDVELAGRIWQRVKEHLPRSRSGREVCGLNERFRFYRYTPGQLFDWHSDGYFERENGERSLLTFMIYLSEGYEGGETRFEGTQVAGRTGMGLVFPHGLLHTGAEVLAGTKYVIRSDVMYGRPGKFSSGW